MLHRDRRRGHDPRRVSDFEEKWCRRAALLVGAMGLVVAGSLLGIGISDRSRELASESLVPCGTLVDRCIEPLLVNAHAPPVFRPLAIPDARKQQMMECFKQGPLYLKIHRETVQWMEEESNPVVVHDNWDERRKLFDYLASRFLEINDAAFIANLEQTPQGRYLIETAAPDEISKDRTVMAISYVRTLTHYDCLITLDMNKVRGIQKVAGSRNEDSASDQEVPSTRPGD
jgi:hypothetical protein